VENCRAHEAKSCFGARLQAALVTQSVRNHVSRSDAVELTEELFGGRIRAASTRSSTARPRRSI
jgi:hypothetical protein